MTANPTVERDARKSGARPSHVHDERETSCRGGDTQSRGAGSGAGQCRFLTRPGCLFEFGYFYGHFGRKKTALLKYGELYLPTDFGGHIHIHGSTFFKRGAAVKVGKRTESEFGRWLAAL